MFDALRISLNVTAISSFIVYILVAGVLFALFQFVYTRITPHREFQLIREGNTAAAVALGGALVGFALPASNVIAYSQGLMDVVAWVVIAAIVQLVAFFIVSRVIKGLSARIVNGEMAAAIYAASVAISVGLLNAACMTPAS
jgi:putative membrane protein